MTKYSKFNIVYYLQKWMDSVPGQTFLNYAYSWGASIVILGTLFKLTHLPGANLMLFIGMGTEVFVFFISAFDRPFDKTTDGMDLQTHYVEPGTEGEGVPAGEAVAGGVPMGGVVVGGGYPTGGYPSGEGMEGVEGAEGEGQGGQVAAAYGGGGGAGGTIIIGGGGGAASEGVVVVGGGMPGGVSAEGASVGEEGAVEGGVAAAGGAPAAGGVPGLSTAWVGQQQQVSPEMAEATENYVEELKRLTEMLGKVNEQSVRLTRDSEEMENLNRTLTGICKVYEMQLKGVSQQIGTIDEINEQSKRMAQQIEQLNQIYARMIEAMTVNMRGGASNPPAGINP